MKKLAIFAAVLLSLAGLSVHAQTTPFAPGETLPDGLYTVERVIDIDTLVILQAVPAPTPESGGAMSGGIPAVDTLPATVLVERSVRVLGIDGEERGSETYVPARDFARTLLEGQTVTLTAGDTPVDRYGRALATVTLPYGIDYALETLKKGLTMTQMLTGSESYAGVYEAAMQGAQSVGKGIWAGAAFVDRNCSSFESRALAQSFYEGAYTPERPDRHQLDRDRDGSACQ